MSLQFQQYIQADFSGGVTDYIYDAKANQCEVMDNVVLNSNRKPYLADGISYSIDAAMPSYTPNSYVVDPASEPNATLTRPTGLFYTTQFGVNPVSNVALPSEREEGLASNEYKLYHLGVSVSNVYPFVPGGPITEITGPTGNTAYSAGMEANNTLVGAHYYLPKSNSCFSEWNGHVLTTNSDYSSPIKVISQSGVLTAYNIGLPELPDDPTVVRSTGAGSGSNYIYHFCYYHTYTTTVGGATNTFEVFGGTTKINMLNIGAIGSEIVTLTNIPLLTNSTYAWYQNFDTTNVKIKIYRTIANGTNAYYIGQVNNANVASQTATITIAAPGVVTVAAATVVTMATFAPVVFTTTGALPTGITAGTTYYVTIASPTTFKISTSVANAVAGVYVTTSGAQSGVHTIQIQNGFFTDSTTDAALLGQQVSGDPVATPVELYTNGGVLSNTLPPRCKFIHVLKGITYYANICEITDAYPYNEFHPMRVIQSGLNSPDICNSQNYIDFPEEVTGISSWNDNLIVFTKNHAYRVNGQFDELGQGQIDFEDITKNVGCISHYSIVQTNVGLVWAAADGFYWTDGFGFSKISKHINETYKSVFENSKPTLDQVPFPDLGPYPVVTYYTDISQIMPYGVYDKLNERVYWSVRLNQSSTDNDSFIILDLKFGSKEEGVFTIRTFGENIYPSCIAYSTLGTNGVVIGESRGYFLYQDKDILTDITVDTSLSPSDWEVQPLIPTIKTNLIDFGAPNVKKWVPKVTVKMSQLSKALIQANSYNDGSLVAVPLKEIRSFKNCTWDDPYYQWSDSIIWNDTSTIEEMRRFPATKIRCITKQVEITYSDTIIYNSDDYGLATTVAATHTVTFAPTYTNGLMPDDLHGYRVSFVDDEYVKEYEIISQSGNTVTVSDPYNTFTTKSNSKWQISGIAKNQDFTLDNYIIHFAPLTTQSFKTWRSEQDTTGANV